MTKSMYECILEYNKFESVVTEIKWLLVYHDKCNDGTCCKWLFEKVFPEQPTLGFSYGKDPPLEEIIRLGNEPKVSGGVNVIIADFSFPPDDLDRLCKIAKTVTVIDHHQTAINKEKERKTKLPENLSLTLDITRCGAQLMWDTLISIVPILKILNPCFISDELCMKPETNEPDVNKIVYFGDLNYFSEEIIIVETLCKELKPCKKRPWIVEMIGDRDLWVWRYPWSKDVSKCVFEEGYLFTSFGFDKLFNDCPTTKSKKFSHFQETGKNLNLEHEKNMNFWLKNTYVMKLKFPSSEESLVHDCKEYTVGVCSPPYHLRSDVGNVIAEKFVVPGTENLVDFALLFVYDVLKDEFYVSCRARETSSNDLSKIMTLFPNGGGHPKAAGGTIYGPFSNPPEKWLSRKGENLRTYLFPFWNT